MSHYEERLDELEGELRQANQERHSFVTEVQQVFPHFTVTYLAIDGLI